MLDEIAIHCILNFLPFGEWEITKPFLISKSFEKVFNSTGFCREYYFNILKLTREDQEVLTRTVELFSTPKYNLDDEKKKHKKNDLPKRNVKSFSKSERIYQNMLQLYIRCSKIALDQDRLKHLVGNMSMDGVEKRLNLSRLNQYLNDNFTQLKQSNPSHMGTKSQVFLTSFFEILHKNYHGNELNIQHAEFVIFTDCGFPIIFRDEYATEYDLSKCSSQSKDILYFMNVCHKKFNSERLVVLNPSSPFKKNEHSKYSDYWGIYKLDQGNLDTNVWEEVFGHYYWNSMHYDSEHEERYSKSLYTLLTSLLFREQHEKQNGSENTREQSHEFFNKLQKKNYSSSSEDERESESSEEEERPSSKKRKIVIPSLFDTGK